MEYNIHDSTCDDGGIQNELQIKKIKKSIDEGLIGIYHYPSCKRVLGVGDGSLIKYG